MERILYSQKEAAALLSISLSTLEQLIARKEIVVRRVGRRVLVPRTELERLARRDVLHVWPEKEEGKTVRAN
jgi:excisionase family DNA binding protein